MAINLTSEILNRMHSFLDAEMYLDRDHSRDGFIISVSYRSCQITLFFRDYRDWMDVCSKARKEIDLYLNKLWC